MKKNLSGSMFAGIWLGCIFGLLTHTLIAFFLAAGPHLKSQLVISGEIFRHMYFMAILCGILPGVVLGFCGGLFAPSALYPGSFSLLIGSSVWITCTGLTWFAYWNSVMETSSIGNAMSVFAMIISFILMYITSEDIGQSFEKLRYHKR